MNTCPSTLSAPLSSKLGSTLFLIKLIDVIRMIKAIMTGKANINKLRQNLL